MPSSSFRHVVLVVEDDPIVRLCALEGLRQDGFEVLEAEDGEEALDVLSRRPDISVIFSDINMPGSVDGLELARRVSGANRSIRIVLTSGRVWPDTDPSFPWTFVAKPYTPEGVSRVLHSLGQPDV